MFNGLIRSTGIIVTLIVSSSCSSPTSNNEIVNNSNFSRYEQALIERYPLDTPWPSISESLMSEGVEFRLHSDQYCTFGERKWVTPRVEMEKGYCILSKYAAQQISEELDQPVYAYFIIAYGKDNKLVDIQVKQTIY